MKRRDRIVLILILAVAIVGLVLDAFVMAAPAQPSAVDEPSAPAQPSMADEPSAAAQPSMADDQRWTRPLQPRPEVVVAFDPPDDPYGPGHRGVDLAGRVGQPVLAVADGRVSFVGMIAGRGVVVVDHGEERSTYEPVVGTVQVGEPVRAGEALGRLELIGSHCWPAACLHLGRVDGDTYLDPLELLGGGPVRLLPFHDGPPPSGPAVGDPPGDPPPSAPLAGHPPDDPPASAPLAGHPPDDPPASAPLAGHPPDDPSAAAKRHSRLGTVTAVRALAAVLAAVFG